MRVMQLIDSLHPGGAERMAVTFANELSAHLDKSYLCVSREEGLLNSTIVQEVGYCFLNKKSTFDLMALRKLLSFVNKNKIEIIHAHSSSFFYATLIRIVKPSVRLIWHDHYGNSEMLEERASGTLKWSSIFFSVIISVNENLKDWAIQNLKCKKVVFLNNFVTESMVGDSNVILEGAKEFRIVCLANLRPQKDHLNLFRAFQLIKEKYPLASLHLIGKINRDAYYDSLVSFISENSIDSINLYGAQNNIIELLKTASVGVLSSKSEGLPVSLLEYGLAGLPIVCTDVGQCKEVVNNYGKIVPSNNYRDLAEAIKQYFQEPKSMEEDAFSFSKHISKSYSFESILPSILNIYKNQELLNH